MQRDGTDRFDLEFAITECYNTADDLKLLAEEIMECELDRDRIFNIIIGIEELTRLRCDKAFKVLEELVRDRKFNEPCL